MPLYVGCAVTGLVVLTFTIGAVCAATTLLDPGMALVVVAGTAVVPAVTVLVGSGFVVTATATTVFAFGAETKVTTGSATLVVLAATATFDVVAIIKLLGYLLEHLHH